MGKQHLVTNALISAVEWFVTAPESIIKEEKGGDGNKTWKEKAYEDLCNTLNRVKTPYSQEALNGFEFEKTVYNYASSEKTGGTAHFQKVCNTVKGYSFYQKKGIAEDVCGLNCYLYVKPDALKPTDIIDIKTTGKYELGKYLKTFQHKLYCYVYGIREFKYLIVEWEKFPKIKNVWEENYTAPDRDGVLLDEFKQEIHDKIWNTFEVIKNIDLWGNYRENFCLY